MIMTLSTVTADLETGRRYQGHAKDDAEDNSKGFIIKSQRRCSGQSAETGECVLTGQAAKTNEVVLGIFVVGILRILRSGRVQSSDMVLDLLTMKQSVGVLEVMTASGKWHRVGGEFGVAQAR